MHDPRGYGYPPTGYPPTYAQGYSPWAPGYAPGFPAHAAPPPGTPVAATTTSSHLTNPRFLKGALFGALAAYLLSNETVQQNMIKAAVRTWSMVQGGVEEMKERFRDAEAELHATHVQDDED
jgi:Na+/H+-translocating membrane pyrophosphatase